MGISGDQRERAPRAGGNLFDEAEAAGVGTEEFVHPAELRRRRRGGIGRGLRLPRLLVALPWPRPAFGPGRRPPTALCSRRRGAFGLGRPLTARRPRLAFGAPRLPVGRSALWLPAAGAVVVVIVVAMIGSGGGGARRIAARQPTRPTPRVAPPRKSSPPARRRPTHRRRPRDHRHSRPRPHRTHLVRRHRRRHAAPPEATAPPPSEPAPEVVETAPPVEEVSPPPVEETAAPPVEEVPTATPTPAPETSPEAAATEFGFER